MSNEFVKIYGSILQSTIWLEDPETKVVWVTMLALADPAGNVYGSVPGLAKTAGVTVTACRTALEKFRSPDYDSATPDHEGRRLFDIDGGWHLINHAKYRQRRTDKQVNEAERQRKHREKVKCDSHACHACHDRSDQIRSDHNKETKQAADAGGVAAKNTSKSKTLRQRIIDTYNHHAANTKYWEKFKSTKESSSLLGERIKDDDFMDAVDSYFSKVVSLDWPNIKTIVFCLRRKTFDMVMSGEWTAGGKSESKAESVDPKTERLIREAQAALNGGSGNGN